MNFSQTNSFKTVISTPKKTNSYQKLPSMSLEIIISWYFFDFFYQIVFQIEHCFPSEFLKTN